MDVGYATWCSLSFVRSLLMTCAGLFGCGRASVRSLFCFSVLSKKKVCLRSEKEAREEIAKNKNAGTRPRVAARFPGR